MKKILKITILLFMFLVVSLSLTFAEETAPDQTSAWEQGVTAGKNLMRDVLKMPGSMLYAPLLTDKSFQTFNSDASKRITFKANISAKNYTQIGNIKACILGVESEGIRLKFYYNNSSIFEKTVAIIGEKGIGVPVDSGSNLDFSPIGGNINYYIYQFTADSSGSNVFFLNSQLASSVSHITEKNIINVLGNLMCVSPAKCNVTENTVWLNYTSILDKIENGVLWAVTSANPNYIVSANTDVSSNCIELDILEPATKPNDDNLFKCSNVDGTTLPTCVSIANLEKRGENFYQNDNPSLLNQGESYILTARAKSIPFYKNDETGYTIGSPYKILSDKAYGKIIDNGESGGETFNCIVTNQAWGSRLTGWVNNINGTLCFKGDWDCIEKAVSNACSTYDLDSSCFLLEEKRDGIIIKQFNKDTGIGKIAGGFSSVGSAICWFPVKISMDESQYQDYIDQYAPSWVKSSSINIDGQSVSIVKNFLLAYDETYHNWKTCGDFQVITRTYYCKNKSEKCVDDNGNVVDCYSDDKLTQLVENSLNINGENIYDFSTDTLTGHYSVNKNIPGQWDINTGDNVKFVSGGVETDCPTDEQVCVVAWCADTSVYSDLNSSNGMGSGIKDKQCYKYTQDIRQCENGICPIGDDEIAKGAFIYRDCSCKSFFGEAVGYLAMLRTAPMDIKCGSKYTDAVTEGLNEVDEQNDKPHCTDDSADLSVDLVCGANNTVTNQENANLCEPIFIQRPEALSPLTGRLYIDDEYNCHIRFVEPE